MATQPSLTTVILTKNQSEMIEPLLMGAVKASQTVILLDDFSDDILKLRTLAEKHGATIVQHELGQDFAQHRNSVFSHISSDWTLFLDSDELPNAGFWEELTLLIDLGKYDTLCITRRNRFLARELRFGEAGQTLLLRAARTKLGIGKWERAVHEVWNVPSTKSVVIHTRVVHQAPESITEFIAKLNRYAGIEREIRQPLSLLSCLVQLSLFPPGKFIWNYFLRQGFRDGFPGFVLAFLMSYYSAIERIQQYEKSL